MSKIKHNKKRNVGIIYELLVKNMSRFLIEQKNKDANKIKTIIENNFSSKTELFKEYKAYKSLMQKEVFNESHAVSILIEAKEIIKDLNVNKLSKQKSKLIKDINYSFGKSFYYENLKNYKELATIQTTINEWKKGISANTDLVIDLEKKIIKIMTEVLEKKEPIEKNSKSDKLVMEIMTKKINDKYKNLSINQKEIIKNYALYESSEKDKLVLFLKESKRKATSELNSFEVNNENNFLKEKITKVKNNIDKLDENIINDQNIIKFLTLTKLVEELKSEE